MEQAIEDADEKPRWRRIVDFPLIAMVIAIALFALATAGGVYLGRFVPNMPKPGTAAGHALIFIVLLSAVYKTAIATLGERPRDDLPARGALKNLGLGIVAGVLLFSMIVGVAAALRIYRIIGPGSSSTLLLQLISTAIMPGFMEELLFRGILFRWLEDFAGTWAGLVLSSLAFGFVHFLNPDATLIACLWIAIEAGILLGGAYMLTRSLWMPIGLHAAWNFAQGAIFGVPVSGNEAHGLVQAKLVGPVILSGGGFGLEASIIALVVATAAGLLFVALAVRRGELMPPWWVRRQLSAA